MLLAIVVIFDSIFVLLVLHYYYFHISVSIRRILYIINTVMKNQVFFFMYFVFDLRIRARWIRKGPQLRDILNNMIFQTHIILNIFYNKND